MSTRRTGSRGVALRCAALCALLVSEACHPPATPPTKPQRTADTRTGQRRDVEYEGGGHLHARHFELRQTIALEEPASFARLTKRQSALLEHLRADSSIRTRVYVIAERALIVPQARHPAGALELLICSDSDDLVVFSEDQWAYRLPLARLPDVLDRSEASSRSEFGVLTLEETPRAKATDLSAAQLPPLGLRAIKTQLTLKYGTRAQHPPWSLRMQLQIFTPAAQTSAATDNALYALMLPFLQTPRGQLVSESLRQIAGSPTGWVRQVINESFATTSALRVRTELDDRGWVKLPIKRFAAVRPGYRTAARLGPPRIPGTQLIGATKLEALRSGGDTAHLRLHNLSPVAALVYLDGALIGWVAPHNKMSFSGLREGFYRIHAVAPTGVRSWGPKDVYAPGTVTLR